MSTATWTSSGHLLGLEPLSREQIFDLIDDADSFLPVVRGTTPCELLLRDRIVANLFLENSTRTRISFSVATQRLGGRVVDLLGSTSSVSKGESLIDTASNIAAMGVDAIVVRCSASGGAALIAEHVDIPVINAGDGQHEHPTQGLLDLMTLRQHFERNDLEGLTVAIVGDIRSSRVARSNIWGLTAAGADVVLVGPKELVPAEFTSIVPETPGRGRVHISHDLDAVLGSIDAIMMLRIQFERHDGEDIPEDYRESYGLDAARAARLGSDVPILHPGPINRGLELAHDIADGPRSLILQQVTNGVAVRMATLAGLLASGG